MDLIQANTDAIKAILGVAAVALVLVWWRLKPRVAQGLLIALGVLAVLNYVKLDARFLSRNVDSYDLIHYYLSAKYFDEVGYYGLYPALLLADRDNGPLDPKLNSYHAKSPSGYEFGVAIEHAIERGKEYREAQFTPARWAEFEHDFLYLQRDHRLGKRRWKDLISDRGFNGTPYWVVVAAPIAQAVPVEAIKALCWIDVALLAGALVLLRRAYGLDLTLFSVLFLFVTHSTRWPFLTWAYLRYDWVAALIATVALLKMKRNWMAGVFSGYATLMRLFPGAWLCTTIGAACFALLRRFKRERSALLQSRSLRVPVVMFALGALLCVVSFVAVTAVREGPDVLREHALVMGEHTDSAELTSRRVGLAIALVYEGGLLPKMLSKAQKQAVEEMKPLRVALVVVLLGLLCYGLRRKDLDESFALGVVPFFLLATASYYYYVARITLVILHAARFRELPHRVALAFLFLLEVLTNGLQAFLPEHRVTLIGQLSWGLTLYTFCLVAWYAWSEWKLTRGEQAFASPPASSVA